MGSTDTWALVLLETALEPHDGRAEKDLVVGLELGALHALPVDRDPVRRAEVDDPVGAVLAPDLGVAAGDVRIVDGDIGTRASVR